MVRTLAPVDDFSENAKASLKSKDCEDPVSLKILIGMGMESDISLDNDTETSWIKGRKIFMTDLDGPLASPIGLARVFSLRSRGGVSYGVSYVWVSDKTIRLGLHANLFLRHSPLLRAATNQVTFSSAIVTC